MGHVHRRLIAFDLDGTLIDSRQDLADSANALIAELGGTPLSTSEVVAMVGEGAALLVKRALHAAGLPESDAALARFLAIYDTRLLHHTRAYPGVRDTLALAGERATVAVLTNKPLVPTQRILDGLELRPLVQHVIGGDGPYPRKPDPAGLQALMAMAGVDSETTMVVGDSRFDRETARRAGSFCCLVTYGFGAIETPAGPREWIVDSADALAAVITTFVNQDVRDRGRRDAAR